MSKIKENIKLYKREVIVSLVTMIIISVGKILFRYIKDGGRHFLNIFSDLIYYEMGRISDFSIIYSFCGFCIAVFLGTLLIISIELIFGRDNSVQKKNNFKVPRKVLGIEITPEKNGGIITIKPVGKKMTYGVNIVNKIPIPIQHIEQQEENPNTLTSIIKITIVSLIVIISLIFVLQSYKKYSFLKA